jgi:protein-disulfide isomerase
MATKAKRTSRRSRPAPRETNWLLIGGIVLVGVVLLFALLLFSLRETEPDDLAAYCNANPQNCFFKGPADAPVTFVEISDYNCPACRTFHQQTADRLIAEYVDTGQMRWVVLPYALRAETVPAAASVFCAAEQDRWFEYHEALFDLQGTAQGQTRPGFLQVADRLGLDTGAFGRCLDDGAYSRMVQQNIRAANGAGVRATPSFFVNGFKVEGAHPFATFQQRIESLLNF